MLGAILIFVIFGLLSYAIWRRIQILKLRDKLGLKGPPVHFFFGNLLQILSCSNADMPITTTLNEWRKEYGDVYGYYFGPRLTIFVADLEIAKEILIKQFDCFMDRMYFALDEPKPNSNSLILLKDQKWKEIRRALTPTFTASKMKQMSNIISEKIDIFMGKMEEYAKSQQTFDIYEDFQALTLDVIGQCAYAMQVHCQTDEKHPFLVGVKEIFNLYDRKNFPLVRIALVLPEFRWLLSTLHLFTRLSFVEQKLTRQLKNVVEIRKQTFDANKSVDVLHILLEQQMNLSNGKKRVLKLTDDVIVANSSTFLLAGYETTSTSLAFTSWLLAKHQDVQRKLQAEIDEKFGSDRDINYDFVHKLPYMDAVFHEALRIYPPVIQLIQRTCMKPCQIGDLKFVPGVQVNIPLLNIHNDPEFWPNPEKFDPERFMGDKTYNSFTWLPFGIGPRNCVGMRFADMEYKMTLVHLLLEFDIVFGPDSETDTLNVVECYSILQRPKHGVRIKLVKRTQNARHQI